MESLIGMIIMVLFTFWVIHLAYPIGKQDYLVSLLEDVVNEKQNK